jgi:hypothetical protein
MSVAMTVQCGGCAVTGNANELGTPLSVYPPFVLAAVYSNYIAKTVRTDCRQRMQLAILFLCTFFISGLVLIIRVWRLSSYRSDASAKRAGRRAHRANDSHIEFDLLELINSLTKTRASVHENLHTQR